MNAIDTLLAIEDIRRLKARYFRLVDTKDWDAFRGLFTDEAALFFPEAMERPAPIDAVMPLITQSLSGCTSIHHGHMGEIDIHDDHHATGIWAMEDRVFNPSDPDVGSVRRIVEGAGHYHEHYSKSKYGWRISSLELRRLHLERRDSRDA